MKNTAILVRLTSKEKSFIKQQAAAAGIPVSAFVRDAALGITIQTKTDVTMIKQLRSLGGLCKTLFKEGADPAATGDALRELQAAAARLAPR